MLTTKAEIEIVSKAWEPGIKDPTRPRIHFQRILKRFFKNVNFKNKVVLDLGPGHYDFGELVRPLGARVINLELDPAVIELGRHKGFEVMEADLKDPSIYSNLPAKIDVLFCRGSINAGWFPHDATAHRNYLENMIGCMSENSVAWVSPCNAPINNLSTEAFLKSVSEQAAIFKKNGFVKFSSNKWQCRQYGIWSTPPRLIYTKNLSYHQFPW